MILELKVNFILLSFKIMINFFNKFIFIFTKKIIIFSEIDLTKLPIYNLFSTFAI